LWRAAYFALHFFNGRAYFTIKISRLERVKGIEPSS
jgi:hypothetical protein